MIIFLLIYGGNSSVTAILLVLVATQLPAILKRKQALLLIVAISFVHFILVFDGTIINTFFNVIIYFMLQIFGFSSIETILREEQAKEELAAIN